MKIECIANSFKTLPISVYEGLHGFTRDTLFDELEVGQQLVVYGINTFKKHLWYLVETQGLYGTMYHPNPMYYPSHLFKIIDGKLSKYWIVKEGKDSYDNNAIIVNWGFPELVENEYFYNELIEDISENISIFKKYKKLMDFEFPNNNIEIKAEIIDENWIMCPKCTNAFEVSNEGLIQCEKCGTIMNNPLYKGYHIL